MKTHDTTPQTNNDPKQRYKIGFQSLALVLMFCFLGIIVFVPIPKENQQILTSLGALAFSAAAAALGYNQGLKNGQNQ